MDTGTGNGTVCLQERGSRDFTNGSNVIRYSGEEPLAITKVDLVDGDGLEVDEALLVPVRPELVGSWSRWPPPKARTALRGAEPAVGAQMGGGRANEYNLVAHLTRSDVEHPIAAAALRLSYTVGKRKYGSVAAVRIGVRSDSDTC
jgi:hypothetical protein